MKNKRVNHGDNCHNASVGGKIVKTAHSCGLAAGADGRLHSKSGQVAIKFESELRQTAELQRAGSASK